MLILLNTNINFICFDVLRFLHNNTHKKNIQSVNIFTILYTSDRIEYNGL